MSGFLFIEAYSFDVAAGSASFERVFSAALIGVHRSVVIDAGWMIAVAAAAVAAASSAARHRLVLRGGFEGMLLKLRIWKLSPTLMTGHQRGCNVMLQKYCDLV